MFLSSLDLSGYRNYRRLHSSFSPGINLISGSNAQGKTNLVESIYYLSIGKAYRPARDEQLILWGAKAFQINGCVENRAGKTEIEIRYTQENNPEKHISAGGLRVARWEEVSGLLTSVLFSPESMSMIKGAPQERRSFLDYDIGQISRSYTANLYKYRRLLTQRNALLKKLGSFNAPSKDKLEQLSVWDQQLIQYGSRIIEKRISFLEKMTPLVRLTQRRITEGKENMEIRYKLYSKSSAQMVKDHEGKWDVSGFLQEEKERSLQEDLRYGSTHWGPHRDDIVILLDGVDVRQFGSQGQQRSGVLAMKLAELEVFRGESGEYPILLLDDVLSELDEERQRQLMQIIHEKSIQCMITSAELRHLDALERKQSKRFLVQNGEMSEME